MGSNLDYGHFGAEACEGLPELDADRAPAEDRQRPGSSLGIAACRLVQNSTLSSAGIAGMAAVLPLAITKTTRAIELLASDVDSAQVRQLAFTSKEPRSRCFHRRGGPAVIEIARHRPHAFGDLGEVDSPFDA